MPNETKFANNDYADWENIELTVPSASDITIYVKDSGTETATVKYLNKGSLGKGFVLRAVNNDVAIVTIQNKTFRSPITVTQGTAFAARQINDFNIIVIRTTSSNTVFELLVL